MPLKENQQYFRTMWESLQAGVAVIDAETFNVVDVNDAALRILRAKEKTSLVTTVGNTFVAQTVIIALVVAQGKTVHNVETVFKDIQGRMVPVLKTVEKIELKGKPYLLDFIEITKLKEAQKKLEKSEQRFRDVAVSTSDLVWEFNAEGIYTYCSENSTVTLGYSPYQRSKVNLSLN